MLAHAPYRACRTLDLRRRQSVDIESAVPEQTGHLLRLECISTRIVSQQSENLREPGRVKLQILIRPTCRTEQGIARIRELLTEMQITITASGQTTISAEMSVTEFENLFGTTLSAAESRGPGESDFGRSGGFTSGRLQVPVPLQEYVESIAVSPPHMRM
jgi:hypothetical protein